MYQLGEDLGNEVGGVRKISLAKLNFVLITPTLKYLVKSTIKDMCKIGGG